MLDSTGSTAKIPGVGVSVNELVVPVLCLNLQARDKTSVAKLKAIAARQGEPVHLSLRALLRCAPTWNVDLVYVCENASIVAIAADRLGAHCAPLVCTDGMPAAAQQGLLGQLQYCGAQLHYHGDFDWPGLRIGNFVLRRFRDHKVSRSRFQENVAAKREDRNFVSDIGPLLAPVSVPFLPAVWSLFNSLKHQRPPSQTARPPPQRA